MKKTLRLVAVLMIVAMLSISLVSCGKTLTGKYSVTVPGLFSETTTTYEFGLFGKVTKTVVTETIGSDPETIVIEGKYEIMEDPENPDNLKISFEFEGEERATFDFVEGIEGNTRYIKIGVIQYKEVK